MRFSQRQVSDLIPMGLHAGFAAREVRPFQPRARTMPVKNLKQRRASEEKCIGDVVVWFHNAGGLKSDARRDMYMQEMLRGVHVLGVCELGVDAAQEASFKEDMHWRPG